MVYFFLILYSLCYMPFAAQQGINQLLSILETCHQPWVNGLTLLEDREHKKHYLSTGCERYRLLLMLLPMFNNKIKTSY